MTSSVHDQNDDVVLDTVPLDLLLIHRRLEDDGGSWRTALPRPDKLLRRVWARPSRNMLDTHKTDEARATSAGLSSTPLANSLRPHPASSPVRGRR